MRRQGAGRSGPGPTTGGGTPAGENAPGGTTTTTTTTGGTTSPSPKPFRFAPYADMAGWPPPPLDEIRRDTGADRISLAFVVQNKKGGCDPTWGAYDEYPAAGATPYRRDHVKAFQQSGGDVVLSFGGAEGTELALVCDDEQLVTAYRSVIDAYGATHVDFDIEGAAVHNTLANTRRAKAIAKLQRERPGLVVTYTLASAVYGLEPKDEAILDDALAQGVDVAAVNIMTMNFGAPFAPDMGALTIQAANGLHGQLAQRYPALTSAQLWGKVGITPMLGINDTADQIFTVADARDVAAFAAAHDVGMVGVWSMGRDIQCLTPVTTKQPDCSGVDQEKWAFTKALIAR